MIDSDSDDTIVRQEGGTGLLKLWRMSGRMASERYASFGFERDAWRGEFEGIGEYLAGYGARMPAALHAEQRRIAGDLKPSA